MYSMRLAIYLGGCDGKEKWGSSFFKSCNLLLFYRGPLPLLRGWLKAFYVFGFGIIESDQKNGKHCKNCLTCVALVGTGGPHIVHNELMLIRK